MFVFGSAGNEIQAGMYLPDTKEPPPVMVYMHVVVGLWEITRLSMFSHVRLLTGLYERSYP
jgi:dienelactone hydrolase